MLTWLKGLLGVAPVETKQEPLVLENPVVEPIKEKSAESKPAKPKKAATKKAPAETTEAPKKRGRKPKALS